MLKCDILLLAGWIYVSTTSAVVVTSLSTLPSVPVGQTTLITPPPTIKSEDELRKRQESSRHVCGVSGTDTWACLSRSFCAGTIISGRAYQYCSDTELGAQTAVYTKALGHQNTNNPCTRASTGCCYGSGSLGAIQTNLFIADGYTVTGFGCAPRETTISWSPYKNLLDPAAFSVSLAQATSSSSSSAPPSTSSQPQPRPSPNTGGGGLGTGKSTEVDSGLSSGTKISIGAGVGAGVGVVLLGALAFYCWRRQHNKKKQQRLSEISPVQQPYIPAMSYNHHQYYQHGPISPQWSPQPSYPSPGSPMAPQYPVDVETRYKPQELQS